jgi:hypothetical protein
MKNSNILMKLPKHTFSDIPREDIKELLEKYYHPNTV